MISTLRDIQGSLSALILLAIVLPIQSISAGEWSGYVEGQVRYFMQAPLDPVQTDHTLSVAVEPEYYHRWENVNQSLTFRPFLRLDSQDDQRSHADIRELVWIKAGEDWEFHAGIGKVFWGVTEVLHLVDIINQTDLVENPDGEQKLGQPMLKLSLEKTWGILDLFVLPGFRERTFPGEQGRPRTVIPVDTDLASFESDREHRHIDLSIRWSQTLGDWDVGLSHFYGTSRDPSFDLIVKDSGELVLAPHYAIINQTGLDLQATKGDWLWKLEAIRRTSQGDPFYAATGGFEYTYVGIAESDIDVGILTEYMYDDRAEEAPVPFENDLFFGLRLTVNDVQSTELLTGIIKDLDSSAWMFNLESSRRLGADWKASTQIRLWNSIPRDDPLHDYSKDDYIEVSVKRYF